jgi:hypothetical protein
MDGSLTDGAKAGESRSCGGLEQLSRLPPDRLADGILPIGDYSRIVPGMVEAARQFMQSAGR